MDTPTQSGNSYFSKFKTPKLTTNTWSLSAKNKDNQQIISESNGSFKNRSLANEMNHNYIDQQLNSLNFNTNNFTRNKNKVYRNLGNNICSMSNKDLIKNSKNLINNSKISSNISSNSPENYKSFLKVNPQLHSTINRPNNKYDAFTNENVLINESNCYYENFPQNVVRAIDNNVNYTILQSSFQNLSLTDADKLLANSKVISNYDNFHLDSNKDYAFKMNGKNAHEQSRLNRTLSNKSLPNDNKISRGHSFNIKNSFGNSGYDLGFNSSQESHDDINVWIQKHHNSITNQLSFSSPSLNTEIHQINLVRKIADDIIKEKDLIIESQRLKIEDMESKLSYSKHSSYYLNPENQNIISQLKDLQVQNSYLMTCLDQYKLNSNFNSAASLEKELCAKEYELNETKKNYKNLYEQKDEETTSLKQQVNDQLTEINDLRLYLTRVMEDLAKNKSDFDKHVKYVSELPNKEEHLTNLTKLKALEETKEGLRKNIARLEKNQEEYLNTIKSKSEKIISLQKSLEEKTTLTDSLKENKIQLEAELAKREDLQKIQQLTNDNLNLTNNIHLLRKKIENTQKIFEEEKSTLLKINKELDNNLTNEKNSGFTIKNELDEKEKNIETLRECINQLSQDNNSLIEKAYKLEEKVKKLSMLQSPEYQRFLFQLFTKLEVCLIDMKNLAKIGFDRLEGKEPNISVLVAMTTNKPSSTIDMSLDQLKELLKQAKQLHLEIDNLRGIVSEKIAEDIGRRITCSQQ